MSAGAGDRGRAPPGAASGRARPPRARPKAAPRRRRKVVRRAARWAAAIAALGSVRPASAATSQTGAAAAAVTESMTASTAALDRARSRLARDRQALEEARPGYPFWRHVFLVPDGHVVYGSARDGKLLVTFPVRGDWRRSGRWEDASLARLVSGATLPTRTRDRRDRVAELLEPAAGPVVHNPTRGDFLLPNVPRYGPFLAEWSAIYERFAVPADVGLAQALVESGLSGTARSEASALGFCQWMPRNWTRLDRLTPHVIEIQNQTTQAAYCAAYLSVLAVRYGSFIPALSEHHAGGANVGRVLINGGRLGAEEVRDRYLAGADLALDLRTLAPRTYRNVVGTYGIRSYLYAEMVFGNAATVEKLRAEVPQERIHAMRARRAIPFAEVVSRSGLGRSDVKRFNPALMNRVPASAVVYLPEPVEGFGPDVSFWHRPAPADFQSVLDDFVALDASFEEWEDPAFEWIVRRFRERFRETGSEEGIVMDAVLGYTLEQIPTTRRVLEEFRTSPRVLSAFREGVELRRSARVDGELRR